MKIINLVACAGSVFMLTACACECADNDVASLKVKFENFSKEEIKTIYLVSNGIADTCFQCIDTVQNEIVFPISSNSKIQFKSNTFGLNKVIEVTNIGFRNSRTGACKCINIAEVNYNYEGNSYTNEPVIITK